MKKIGISTFDLQEKFGWERALELCKENGFDSVDFNLEEYDIGDDIYSGSEDAFLSHFTEIKKKADSLGIEIAQTHGRCVPYGPDDPQRKAWFYAVCEKDLKASAVLGSPACVVHCINTTRWGQQPPALMRKESKEMFDTIIPFAEKNRVKISLETFGAAKVKGGTIRNFFADPMELKWQYDAMDTEYKTICVDSGHTHEAGSFWVPPVEETIRILGKDVTLLHLHDNTGFRDDHLLPGMGNINWSNVFDALDDIGYNGVYNFELRMNFYGNMMEEALNFMGKYLRKFVDNRGKV